MSDPRQQWAGISFSGIRVAPNLPNQTVQRLQTGLEVNRIGRVGVSPLVFDDFSGGFLATSDIRDWAQDKNRFYFNTGIETHIPGHAFIAPALTTQTAVVSADFSGERAANRRVHSKMFNRRWYGIIGSTLIKDTSTSNTALTVPATADNITNNVGAVWDGKFNNVRYFVIATHGQTDDIKGSTDPSADSITWVELVTHANANDKTWAGDFFETLGEGGWNIWIGSENGTNGIWAAKASAAVPVTSPTPVVYADTYDILGNLSAQTTGEKAATLDNNQAGTGTIAWGGSSTVDVAYAEKWAHWNAGTWSDIPNAAYIIGLQPDITLTEDATNNTGRLYPDAVITKGGSQVSVGIGGGQLTSTTTRTPGSVTGGSEEALGTNLRGSDMPSIGIRVTGWMEVPTGTGEWDVTAIDMDVAYQMPGTLASLPLGGFSTGKMKSEPNSMWYIAPQADDESAVTVTREAYKLTFAYDPQGDRPIVSITKPHTGVTYAGILCDFQGGMCIAGGKNESVWDQVKLIDSSNRTLDLGFPGVHGTNQLTITQLYAQGNILFADTAYTDGSEAQLWMYFNGKWSVAGVQQDLSSAISTEPLLWAETTIGTHQTTHYRLFPVSTTALAGARQIIRANMFKDPWLDTAITRHDDTAGNIYLQTVELAAGPPEANTAIATLQFQNRKMDDDTSYGDVVISVETGGDTSMASPAISETFNATAEAFVDRNIVTAKDPGVAYNTMIVRFAPGHQAGTTETPDIIPVVFNLVHQWPHLEQYSFFLEATNQADDLFNIRDRMITAANTKVVQRLLGSGIDVPATLIDFRLEHQTTEGKVQPTPQQVTGATVTFQRVPGSIT